MQAAFCSTLPAATPLGLWRGLSLFARAGGGGPAAPDMGGDFVPASGAGGKACDYCSASIAIGGGHLLSSQEIAASDDYLKYRRESDRPGKEIEEIRAEVLAVRTPWLICDRCIEVFAASGTDRVATRDRAASWWASQVPDERPKGRRSAAPLIVAVAVIVLGGLAASWFLVLKPKSDAEPSITPPTPLTASAPAEPAEPTDTPPEPIDIAAAPHVDGEPAPEPALAPAPDEAADVLPADEEPAPEPEPAPAPDETGVAQPADDTPAPAPAPAADTAPAEPASQPAAAAGKDPRADLKAVLVDAGVPESLADEIVANPLAMMDPSVQATMGQRLADAGANPDAVLAAAQAWGQEHPAEVMAILGGALAPTIATGPPPTGSPEDRLKRRFPHLEFEPLPNGNFVSSTGQLFIVRGGYVYPVEKDFTIGRVI